MAKIRYVGGLAGVEVEFKTLRKGDEAEVSDDRAAALIEGGEFELVSDPAVQSVTNAEPIAPNAAPAQPTADNGGNA